MPTSSRRKAEAALAEIGAPGIPVSNAMQIGTSHLSVKSAPQVG